MEHIPAELGSRVLGLATAYAEVLAQLDPEQQRLARTIFERVVNKALATELPPRSFLTIVKQP